MLSDKVIRVAVYDEAASNSSYGSHHRRGKRGSAEEKSYYWGDSNLRSWLNSKAPKRGIQWLCGTVSPISYLGEEGFLSDANFSPLDRAAIKKVHQKSLLGKMDVECAEGGEMQYWGEANNRIALAGEYYDKISYESVDDMMFLPDDRQLYHVWENRSILGDTYLWAKMTPQLAENLGTAMEEAPAWYPCAEEEELNCSYFTRTPWSYRVASDPFSDYESDDNVLIIPAYPDEEGAYPGFNAREVDDSDGVRPAFYLNEDNVQILSGSGTIEKPYQITGIQAPPDGKDGAIEGVPVKPNSGISIYVDGNLALCADRTDDDPIMENDHVYLTSVQMQELFDLFCFYMDGMLAYRRSDPNAENYYFRLEAGDPVVRSNPLDCTAVKETTWAVAPMKKDERFYVPLRALAEYLGYTVEWIDQEQKVTITKNGESAFESGKIKRGK